jgi:hypothetical protein
MGYYTSFTLHVDKDEEAVGNWLESTKDYDIHYVFEDAIDDNNDWYGNAKWYEYDEDMCILSAIFPDVLFTLTGEGEDHFDNWRKWYRGGNLLDTWKAPEYKIPEMPFSTTHLVN